MRGYVDTCLRNITGFQGTFSPQMESFWRQVELLYQHCNAVNGVPVDHIPLWWARCLDLKVPLEAPAVMTQATTQARMPAVPARPVYDPLAEVCRPG